MSDDSRRDDQKTTIATETLLLERLRYRWHAGYDRDDEPDHVPIWSIMREATEDSESDETAFRHRYDPEHIWIRSDVVYDLTRTI